ncbi:metal-dependent hydrolase [Mycobacteroides abscessus subsp. massiliense]|nr:metal-dependent hydrolase [Mycobacteroides abscessus subsp. massiliense]
MRRTTIAFIYTTFFETVISLLRDKAAYNPVRLVKSIAALRHLPFLSREVRRRIGEYNRPGFHPNDSDNSGMPSSSGRTDS